MVEIQKIEKNLWYVCTRNEYTGDYPDGDLTFKEGFAYKGEDILKEYSEDEIQKYYLRSFRLWTVQDAKPGDFLTYRSEDNKNWYLIYHSEYAPYENHYHYYACYTDKFFTGGTACIDADYLRPSTLKERNILLQKIEEAGYCWDAENHKLTKTAEEIAEEPTAPMTGIGKRMKVITLCGSTRFKEQFLEQQKRLTLEGNIVISVGLFGHSGDEEVWKPGTKEMLDKMHLQKIDMADEIFVINVGGYIGESTKREIAYAEKSGKIVRFLECIEAIGDEEARKDSEELTHSEVTKISDQEESESEDRLRKASKEYLKVLSETPYNNTPVTNAQIIIKELIGYLDNPSKYDPNHVTDISEDLLDEIQYRWEDDPHTKWPKCPYNDFKNIACHFANWQKQQMMKNVTYGEVSQCATYPYNLKIQSIKTIDKDLKVGDKVRLIIFKEE